MERLTHFFFHSLLIRGQVLPHHHPAQRPPGWLLLIITTTSSSLCFRGYPYRLKSEPLLKWDRIRPSRIWTLSCLCAQSPWKRHKDTNNVQIKNFPKCVVCDDKCGLAQTNLDAAGPAGLWSKSWTPMSSEEVNAVTASGRKLTWTEIKLIQAFYFRRYSGYKAVSFY